MSTQSRAARIKANLRPYLRKDRLSSHRFSPKGSALIVIDMQKFFLSPDSHAYLPDGERIIGNLSRIIAAYRARRLPVIFTRQALAQGKDPGSMARWWKDNLRESDPSSEVDSRLRPTRDDNVLVKSQYSAFIGTRLERLLRTKKISSLVITGVMTHLCCESTAREAFMRGFDVFIVVDGTASRNEDLHISSLKTLTDGFAIPLTTSEVLKWTRR